MQSSLSVYVEELAALRIVMKKIHRSPKNRNALENLCLALDVPFAAPVLDVPTRWNSTVDMIENALRLKKPLLKMKDVLQFDPDERIPSEEEFKTLEDLLPFLSPFKTATKII